MRSDQEMGSPAEMAAAYRTEMRRLLDVVDRIPEGLRGTPIHGDWTIREVLVHLAGWDRAVAGSADDVLASRPARLIAMRLEDVNEELVESRRGASVEEARRELADAHQALMDRLDGLPAERWQAGVPGAEWPDGSPMTVASVFAYRYRERTHYGGHAEEIEAWLRERSAGR